MQAVRDRFGDRKVDVELALRTDADQRTAQRWLAGSGMDVENFAALLRSDLGELSLAEVMGPDEARWPDWYRRMKRQATLSSMRRLLQQQSRALAQLETEGV